MTTEPTLSRASPSPPRGDVATNPDHRRPGRPDHVNAHLIPLLRGEAAAASETAPPLDSALPATDDDLAPARGILIGIALGIALWLVALASLMFALLGRVL